MFLFRLWAADFSDSLVIHKEVMTATVFGYLILINIDFDDFISPFSPYVPLVAVCSLNLPTIVYCWFPQEGR